jgi:hypothetical protein
MSISRTLTQAIGLTVVVLVLVGCGAFQPEPTPTPIPPTATPLPPTPAPTPGPGPITEASGIVGTWLFEMVYSKYDEDGTLRIAGSQEGLENEQLRDSGEFWFARGQYFERITKAYLMPPDCVGVTGTYEVELLENGNLLFSLVEDECKFRVDYLMPLERAPVE